MTDTEKKVTNVFKVSGLHKGLTPYSIKLQLPLIILDTVTWMPSDQSNMIQLKLGSGPRIDVDVSMNAKNLQLKAVQLLHEQKQEHKVRKNSKPPTRKHTQSWFTQQAENMYVLGI